MEPDAGRQPETPREVLELPLFRPRADDRQPRIGMAAQDFGHRPQEHVDTLIGLETAETNDERRRACRDTFANLREVHPRDDPADAVPGKAARLEVSLRAARDR